MKGCVIVEETILYQPIKSLLESFGFSVKGEIKDIDIFAIKDDVTLACELKNTITLKVIYQAMDRQKISDIVYIGIPIKALRSHKRDMKSFFYLLRRLEIGLIIVEKGLARFELEPKPFHMEKSIKKSESRKKTIIKEFHERQNIITEGGTKGKKITNYRERGIKLLMALEGLSYATPKLLKAVTQVEDAYNILYHNYDGWFQKKEHGVYMLSDQGRKALFAYRDVLDKK